MRYQRTLLIKNKTSPSISEEKSDDEGSKKEGPIEIETEKRNYQLKRIKDALYEILSENSQGLSLAQIPQHLRKKLDFQFNLQKLGFPKLKNLLSTMSEDVKIELSGTNHSFAILKETYKPISQTIPPNTVSKESTNYIENNEYTNPEYNPFSATNTSDLINKSFNHSLNSEKDIMHMPSNDLKAKSNNPAKF